MAPASSAHDADTPSPHDLAIPLLVVEKHAEVTFEPLTDAR